MATATKSKPQAEIQSAAIYRVRDKETRAVFYLVQSDTQEHTWYEVRWNPESLRWECNCDARRQCKHERAVAEITVLRRVFWEQAAREREREPEVVGIAAPLNGNRGFSLMR